MIEKLKNTIYQNLNELFTTAILDEMTGDYTAYKKKLKNIAQIAEILGISPEIIAVSINIKTGDTIIDIVAPEPKEYEPGTSVIQ